MRKAWLALLLGLSPAFAADDPQALTDLLLRLEAVAQQRPRLSADVLHNQLGLSVDADCVADPTSPGSCWRVVSLPGQGWRDAAGDAPATVSALVLDRLPGPQPCATAAQLGAVFKQPPQPRPQIADVGHQRVGELDVARPALKPMPTWLYPGKSAAHHSQIWMAEDEQGCVKQISLILDMPVPQP